jgi:hypothetical protein
MSASLSIFEKEHAARDKYIYFICGVASALVAYIGKDFAPHPTFTLHDKLTIASLVALILAFGFGLANMLAYIEGLSANKEYTLARESTENFVRAKAERIEAENQGKAVLSFDTRTGEPHSLEQMEKRIVDSISLSAKHHDKMDRWFKVSHYLFIAFHGFLVVGLLLLVGSKVVPLN